MCGIVGALAFGKLSQRDEKIRQKLMQIMTTELLLLTEKRGEDATGAAVLFTDGNYVGIKRGEKASSFLGKFGSSKERYGSLMKSWKEYDYPAKVYIGHCRKGTTGDKEDNENNHPIKVQNILGVHNGVIRNHDEIFTRLGTKRDGKVDSESIFRLMYYLTNHGKEPFTMDMMEAMVDRLTGAYAVLAFNADNLNQIPILRDGRPFELVLIKDLSLMFIISEQSFWNITHFRYERMIGYHGVRMPSLLDMEIEKKMMPDDSAGIFDLSIRCTKETKIDDLWDWKKVPRTNKIWTTQAAINKGTGVGHNSYAGGQKMKEDPNKKAGDGKTDTTTSTNTTSATYNKKTEDKNVMMVFNRITSKYERMNMSDPEKLKEDESKTITVANQDANQKADDAKKDDNGKAQSFKTDKSAEDDNVGADTKLDDRTKYDKKEDPKTSTVNEKADEDPDTEEYIGPITEVDMEQEQPELLEAADNAYKQIPSVNRGYSAMDPLLTDIEVKDEKVASGLGIKVIANRVAKLWWKRGFIAAIKIMRKKQAEEESLSVNKEKAKKQEKHIYNLKSMVVMLATFFNQTNLSSEGSARKRLADISLKQVSTRAAVDVDDVSEVFNAHEKEKVRITNSIIKDAVKYTRTESDDEDKK